MQKEEEDYAVTNTEVGERFMSNAGNSSSPFNPTHTYHGGYRIHQDIKQVDQQPIMESMHCNNGGVVPSINNVDRTLSFADVMQFADFGSKLALNHPQCFQQQQQQQQQHDVNVNPDHKRDDDTTTLTEIEDDTVYFLKFPVLNNPHMVLGHRNTNTIFDDNNSVTTTNLRDGGFGDPLQEIEETSNNKFTNFRNSIQLEFLSNAFDSSNTHNDNLSSLAKSEKTGNDNMEEVEVVGAVAGAAAVAGGVGNNNKSSSSSSKKKRPRTIKTNEEVESQRMTHIAVERNRRKQMNEHLRVLRSLMPSSYVQRGDQASIIGGAIEFVRELEQLLQCLESQKRRRLYGDHQVQARPTGDSSNSSPSSTVLGLVQQTPQVVQPPLTFPPPIANNNNHHHHHQDSDEHHQLDHHLTSMPAALAAGGLLVQEETTTAESKSCVADIEVKVLGFDALIKILSRRRPSQLIKAIAALEDLHFTILHTNVTTIEQTVLYSFNVKVASEGRFTAEDIANSVQQIFTFIHANTSII